MTELRCVFKKDLIRIIVIAVSEFLYFSETNPKSETNPNPTNNK
ncbi:21499_t:CDS:2 [Entrophospora sp. SA101]|nr:21499_t:CDS:2 [Entrophospora sp. SA101]